MMDPENIRNSGRGELAAWAAWMIVLMLTASALGWACWESGRARSGVRSEVRGR